MNREMQRFIIPLINPSKITKTKRKERKIRYKVMSEIFMKRGCPKKNIKEITKKCGDVAVIFTVQFKNSIQYETTIKRHIKMNTL